MKKFALLAAAASLSAVAAPALAQTSDDTTPTSSSRTQDRLNAILGTLFGNRPGTTDTIEAQWAAGRTPLATQRLQFESRIDADMRSGALDRSTGNRIKADYQALVQLEARYGADGRFTTAERNELADRYGALTQVLADRGYGEEPDRTITSIAENRIEFNRRVDSSVAARRLTRTQGIRLKADYSALVTLESSYLRDGTLSRREQDDLDARLDALDERVGDGGYGNGGVQSPRDRLAAIESAITRGGLSAAVRAQLLVEHEDLARLESAYARLTPTAEERDYLDRRLTNLEARARVRR